ncbi:flagellar hook assembly protein FlgD [Roseicella frigidaeris]|uniref:Basal-body rod modification protein FlgD n=1 Tax=Roseicella frigidaeris TaxID=2230885 RepID=A0A327MBD1_9PROT|nr:flagellar hook capping FlgD N-terminal domain-containing protein [Roseicella frigidaeris]RAI59333.1 flagellar biosynthesis protein FlgD [Roseicella frigidaeris]
MTSAISGTSSSQSAGTGSKAGAAATSLGANFDTFLTLLTTQLKNQDPTKAMDTSEMTNQLVQFAAVEQQISMNGNLEKLISLQQAAQLTAAAPLMGKQVEVESDKLALQDGVGRLRLPAAGAATGAIVTVTDANGRTLRTQDVTLGSNATEWQWDGRDGNGNTLADGAYAYSVAGYDATGASQAVSATVLARATAAERQSGGDLKLVLGGLTVGFDAVRSVGGE